MLYSWSQTLVSPTQIPYYIVMHRIKGLHAHLRFHTGTCTHIHMPHTHTHMHTHTCTHTQDTTLEMQCTLLCSQKQPHSIRAVNEVSRTSSAALNTSLACSSAWSLCCRLLCIDNGACREIFRSIPTWNELCSAVLCPI